MMVWEIGYKTQPMADEGRRRTVVRAVLPWRRHIVLDESFGFVLRGKGEVREAGF